MNDRARATRKCAICGCEKLVCLGSGHEAKRVLPLCCAAGRAHHCACALVPGLFLLPRAASGYKRTSKPGKGAKEKRALRRATGNGASVEEM
eukprot:scaffold6640_cov90-Phaeocystis_antarctica.AAC.1